MKKIICILLGIICLILGIVGAMLPILPTVPFLLMAGFCFAKGSERLHDWFLKTKLYQNHVEEFAREGAMTKKKKIKVLAVITGLMGIGFILTNHIHARVAIVVVLLAHYYCFLFRMKTKSDGKPKGTSTRLLELTEKSGRYIFYTVLFRWLGLIGNIIAIMAIAMLLEKGVIKKEGFAQLGLVFIWGLVGVGMRFLCIRQSLLFSGYASREAKIMLRSAIYDKLYSLGLSHQRKEGAASYVQLAVEGVEQIEGYLGSFLPQLFYSMVAPITLFCVFSMLNIKVAVVLLCCVPLIPLSMLIIRKKAGKMMKRHWGGYTDLGQVFLESLQGLATLKLYDADQRRHKAMNETAEGFRKVTMNVLKMQLSSVTIMDFIAYGGAAVGIGMGLMEYFSGGLSFWAMVLVILLSSEFFLPLRLLGSFFHSSMNGIAAAERIFHLLDMPNPKEKTETPQDSSISLQQCSFSYDGQRKALQEVSFEITSPGLIAIVGESGCGKSTLGSILSGVQKEYEGQAMLGKKELKELSEESLTRQVALITHQSYLFQGSVKDHLAMGNPQATEEEMKMALQKVQIADFVMQNGGLEMPIAEEGKNLSGGQKQRLALARAMLWNPMVYILDEAFSGIDAESEEQMLMLLKTMAKERIILLITHRIAAAQQAERIIMMQDGSIIGFDTPKQLYADCPEYAMLYDTQQAMEALDCEKGEVISCFA